MARQRRFYYENVFGVDQFSMKTLRALHSKYTRDYLTFFKSLSRMYGPSPQKREIDDAVTLIQKVRGTIESILHSSTIDRADAKVLYELTGQIEEKKQGMLEQAAETKALRDRLEKIQREVGLSAKDLNVTRQIVRKGVKQAAGQQREGVLDFLSRTAPGSLELGRKLTRGSAAVLAGPFAPILSAGYDIAKGAAGVVGGVRKKMLERQERKLGGRLRSYSPSEGMEDVSRARGVGAPLAGISGLEERAGVRDTGIAPGTGGGRGCDSLSDFWNKGAYKAKYTKELMKVLKDSIGKKSKGSMKNSLLDAVDDFAILGASMLPLLGKAGKFALLAGAVLWTSKQMVGLSNASHDYMKAKRSEQEASEAFTSSVRQWNDLIVKEGIVKVAERLGKTVDQLAKDQVTRERAARKAALAARPLHEKVMTRLNVELLGGRDPSVSLPEDARARQIIRAGGGDATENERVLRESSEKMTAALDKMTKAMEKWEAREREAAQKYPGVFAPNTHDSGDALLNEQANGGLGIED